MMRLFVGSLLARQDRHHQMDLQIFTYIGLHASQSEAVGEMIKQAVEKYAGYSLNAPNAWEVEPDLIKRASESLP